MSALIELCNVEKSYPQGPSQVFVLRRVDLKVDEDARRLDRERLTEASAHCGAGRVR